MYVHLGSDLEVLKLQLKPQHSNQIDLRGGEIL